jgi:asparagine synthase (glutamine-hydrolysing)
MCGILAIVEPDAARRPVARALAALRHRGPDGQGTWQSPRGDAVLAHTRLSIIDIEGGRQPLLNEAEDVAVVVNGEFYDYERVRRDLAARGHRLKTLADSEILAHLYEDHGLQAVERLRGEFAFALWDERRRRLVAGRDRFGVKPLFYCLTAHGLWLASEAKALFAAGLEARWDEIAVHQSLFLVHEAGRSLFRDVHQLPGGHVLVFEDGRATTSRYWDLDYPRLADLPPAGEPDLGLFREALDDAVRVRLRADTPVAYFLSGGIDSSSVVGFASQRWEQPGRAFTVCFDEREYDEVEQAGATAAALGAEFAPIAVGAEELADAYPSAVAHAEVMGNLHASARYLQCRAVQQAGYKVALTGDGADEVLAGYVHYTADLVPAGTDALPTALRPLRERLGHVPMWVRHLAVERSVFSLLLDPDYRARMAGRDPYASSLDGLDGAGQLSSRHPLHQSLYLWSKTMLPNYVLAAERLEMAFAVETRPPFLDHLLFDRLRNLHPYDLVRGLRGKHILRESMRGLVPDAVVNQTKHPFAAPAGLSVPGSRLHVRLGDMFASSTLDDLPFLDAASVRRLWATLPELPLGRRLALEPILLMVFCACCLHERYVRAAAA